MRGSKTVGQIRPKEKRVAVWVLKGKVIHRKMGRANVWWTNICHALQRHEDTERTWNKYALRAPPDIIDRSEQNRNDVPGTEGHQGRQPWVPSNGQNWGKKYCRAGPHTQGDPSSVARCCLGSLHHLTFHISCGVLQTRPWPFFPWHVPRHVVDHSEGEQRAGE